MTIAMTNAKIATAADVSTTTAMAMTRPPPRPLRLNMMGANDKRTTTHNKGLTNLSRGVTFNVVTKWATDGASDQASRPIIVGIHSN
jgi:hypothetical protein